MRYRKVEGAEGRNRFLYHVPWLLLRAKMNWDRWGTLQGNLHLCRQWFDEDPCWMRAFQVWRLLHQMAAFTQHPQVKQEAKRWDEVCKQLDRGEASDREAASKLVSGLTMGLTYGELKALRKLVTRKPNWRFNPQVLRVVRQVDGRTGRA